MANIAILHELNLNWIGLKVLINPNSKFEQIAVIFERNILKLYLMFPFLARRIFTLLFLHNG